VAVGPEFHHLCVLREVRAEEPPIRLEATFYEPGGVEALLGELARLDDAVVAVSAPRGQAAGEGSVRRCDADLAARGVPPQRFEPAALRLYDGLAPRGLYVPAVLPDEEAAGAGLVTEGAFREGAAFETNVEGVFCALQGRRLPARRHPLGVLRRVQELADDHLIDPGGDLWHRRIEEIDAAAAALCAHRYAVGHACWVGDPREGVVVLPGSRLPARFTSEGVLPPMPRMPLGPPAA
jgi:predicted nuclease with RNAse H fold